MFLHRKSRSDKTYSFPNPTHTHTHTHTHKPSPPPPPPFFFFCLFWFRRKNWPRSELVPSTNVWYKSLLWMCTLTHIVSPIRESFYMQNHVDRVMRATSFDISSWRTKITSYKVTWSLGALYPRVIRAPLKRVRSEID